MDENPISALVVDAAVQIHKAVGPGLFESVYGALLAHELEKRGLDVRRQVVIPLVYEGLTFEEAYRADLMLNDSVIVPIHRKQMLTYLKLTGCRPGLLLNFGAALMRDGIERVANQLPDSHT